MKFLVLLSALVVAIVQGSVARTFWNVTVFTGRHHAAGIDSKVYLQIFGKTGFTNYHLLADGGDVLEPGNEDFFKFTSEDIGLPTFVRVLIDRDDGWQLNKIELKSSHYVNLFRFTFNSWLAYGLEWGAFIYGHAVDTVWSVRVFTRNVDDAGCNKCSTYLKIFGPNGICTDTMQLHDPEKRTSKKGEMDEFTFVDINVGNPIFILVWTSITSDTWTVEKIELKNHGFDHWISYPFNKTLGGGTFKDREAIKYADPAQFPEEPAQRIPIGGPTTPSSSTGKLQPAGLLLSTGLGHCLMVAFM